MIYHRFLLFFLLISSLHSYSQRLLKDIAASDASAAINADLFNTGNFMVKGDSLFFLAQDTTMDNYQYRNIWFTNGTTVNTKKVTHKNISNTTVSFNFLASFKGKVYYRDITNANLYATSGNDTTIVKTFESRVVQKASALNGWLYLFVDNYRENIIELWKTDGTEANTTKVTDIFKGTHYLSSYGFLNIGNKIYFVLSTSTYGEEPWVTDGTAPGTKILKDTVPGTSQSQISSYEKVGDIIFFYATNPNSTGWKLWKTDGTEAGTVMVANTIDGIEAYRPTSQISFANQLYFVANTDKLYRTDGNTITLVKSGLSNLWGIVKLNNLMYFIRQNGLDFELWKSDGSTDGTEKIMTVVTIPNDAPGFARLLGGTSKIYIEFSTFSNSGFENITQHWVTDGTAAGTINISTLNPNFSTGSFTNQLAVVGDTYYFTAYDASNGFELWKSNGTSGGTFMVKNINKGIASSAPEKFVALGNEVYFAADDMKYGRELWKTDGTTQNTQLVVDYNSGINPDINYFTIFSGMTAYNDIIIANLGYDLVKFNQNMPPQLLSSRSAVGGAFMNFNNKVFYLSYDYEGGYSLYETDGNSINKVKKISTSYPSASTTFTVYSGQLYFTTNDNTKLWKSDGTDAGTLIVKEFPSGSFIDSKFYEANGILMFRLRIPSYQFELWKTDGTEAGTVIVKDINSGAGGDGIDKLVVFNNMLYFSAYDGSISHIYKTDGTSANTQVFSNILSYNVPAVFKNKLFFISRENNWSPYFLYITDGISTPVKLKQVAIDMFYASSTLLTNANNEFLVFDVVPNYSRHELWVSDGTAAGTKLAKVIRQKATDNYYVNIKEYLYNNHKLYFAADDGIHGKELWILDFDLPCLESMTITNPISQDTDIIVEKYITGSNKINPNIKVNYYASKSISLNPGFETQSGTRFTTSMDGCINLATAANVTTSMAEPIFRNFSTKRESKPGIIQFLNDPLNAELQSVYIAEKNKHNEQNIAWIINELPDRYVLKMQVNGKELIGYLPK